MSEMEFALEIGEYTGNKIEIILELSIDGRPNKNYIPIVLLKESGHRINGYKF